MCHMPRNSPSCRFRVPRRLEFANACLIKKFTLTNNVGSSEEESKTRGKSLELLTQLDPFSYRVQFSVGAFWRKFDVWGEMAKGDWAPLPAVRNSSQGM